MNDLIYSLPTFGRVLSHFPQLQPLAGDGFAAHDYGYADSDEAAELLIRARVRSGDYFVTLATELDKLAQGLAVARMPEAPELERAVAELLYVHRNYRLSPK